MLKRRVRTTGLSLKVYMGIDVEHQTSAIRSAICGEQLDTIFRVLIDVNHPFSYIL